MKKCILLFVILIAVLTLTLVVFACQEDRAVETANAVNVSSSNGIVNPSQISYDNFTSISSFSSANIPSFYATNPSDGVYHDNNDYTINGDVVTINSSAGVGTCVVFTAPSDGYYYCTVSAKRSSGVVSVSSYLYTGTANYVGAQTVAVRTDMALIFSYLGTVGTSANADHLTLGQKVIWSFYSFVGCSLYNVKIERFDVRPSGGISYTFTGFVIPGYTLQPEPSPYDSWDGVVRQNQINSPDFWNYPVFVESTNITDPYKNMWLSNMDGFVYDYNGPDTLGSLKMNVHFYGQNEDPAFLYYYDNYSDSFDFNGFNAHFRLVLNSEVAGTVSLTSGGGIVSDRFDVGLSIVDLILPSSYTTSFISISIVFDQYEGVQNKTCTLFYSKLEAGSLFTGFVIPDHSVSAAVQDNLLNNYDFSSVPLPSSSPRQNNWWYLFDNQQGGNPGEADELITFYSDYGGLTFDTSAQNASGTIYFTYNVPSVEDFNSSGSYVFTVQLWSQNTYGVGVRFTALDGPNDIRYQTVFASSNGPSQFSFRFPKINGVILTLAFPVIHGQVNTLYYAKLEETSFTGFCGNFQEFYDNGYNSGYSEGYSRGSEAYGTSLFTLNFDQPDSYTTLYDFGWSNMGFDDVDAMFASTMTFDYIGFYRTLGYAIAVQKYVDVPSESIRRLYASADINFNVSNISIAQDYVMLELSQYTSRLVIVNDQYPNDYTPEVYPTYRVVRVNVQRGLSNILDSYGGAKFEEGRLAGYDQGYLQGEADGERRGYSQATQVAMNGTGGWFGFVSAFIDVPVKTLTSMLDFDFFGFNLLNIVKIMLVFSLVYLVIRLMTKGKVAQ